MATRREYSGNRSDDRRKTHSGTSRVSSQMYVYGNTVPKPAEMPKRHVKSPEMPKKKTSSRVRRNRRQALSMSSAYVVFLAVAAIMALVVCVNYVQLQSRITKRSKNITAMQEELADLKEENNTKYNAVMDSVNLDEVRDRAQNDLGMVYATPDQIVEYDDPATDYVKQYEDIPEDGVLAQSDKSSR